MDNEEGYQNTVEGFSCAGLENMREKPTIRQLVILKEIMNIVQWEDMESFYSKDKKFTWIPYSLLFKNFEWLRLSRTSLSRDVATLVNLDLIDTYQDNKSGRTKVFFHATEFAEMLYVED